jgi:hypothetical protein
MECPQDFAKEEIMDKRIAGLLGAAAALTAINNAQAEVPATTPESAASYRDLLEPIPNALALLRDEDSRGRPAKANGDMRLAQHHHHHSCRRCEYHHQHGWVCHWVC